MGVFSNFCVLSDTLEKTTLVPDEENRAACHTIGAATNLAKVLRHKKSHLKQISSQRFLFIAAVEFGAVFQCALQSCCSSSHRKSSAQERRMSPNVFFCECHLKFSDLF